VVRRTPEIAGIRCRPGQRRDERCGSLRRQRPAKHRPCRHDSRATALAVAERTGARGEEVLTAIVLGYEAAGRMATRSPRLPRPRLSWLPRRDLRCAVAAARLLQLDPAHMAQAIALSATSIGGLAAAANTSVAREYHAGLAAMLGVQAALAAQRGYRAEESILEAHRGFSRSMAAWKALRASV